MNIKVKSHDRSAASSEKINLSLFNLLERFKLTWILILQKRKLLRLP